MTSTTLEALSTASHLPAPAEKHGERSIPVLPAHGARASELKGLKGLDFYEPHGELFQLKRVQSVRTEILENEDGRFLVLRVGGVFVYGADKVQLEESFTIFIPEEKGQIVAYFEDGYPTYLEPAVLGPVLGRLGLS